MALWWLLIPVAYLVGTFASASLVARAKGVDIRNVGSGNPGASNITRILGWKHGVAVFVLDALKAALMTGLGLIVQGRPGGYVLGAAAVLGHMFPIWHGLRQGGKGVASGGGMILVLHPLVGVAAIAIWVIVSRLTKKASLASIIAVLVIPVGLAIMRRHWWEIVVSSGICAVIIIRHTSNIRRLISDRENALS
ncbi:MAG: glycerol-3-phosphate acyltransferase [Ilumatobacter coccineus]|uniref:Glycerol-3-phosphate acyltransferase n=1 Tax=Ilumatobacter coccineus TaxID=467094 RepID=A0A2G6KCA4_9ACTN|nr:MAG: glycerol-3-phosphate acyltransferase [Ilumatobacter coccineus]